MNFSAVLQALADHPSSRILPQSEFDKGLPFRQARNVSVEPSDQESYFALQVAHAAQLSSWQSLLQPQL